MQWRGLDPPLSRIFLVESFFPLELAWVLTPFPKTTLSEESIIFQKRHWRKKSFQKKKGHFAHIGNEIKSVAKINATITFPTSVKIHFVCFTVVGSFLITIHLFGSLNFPG